MARERVAGDPHESGAPAFAADEAATLMKDPLKAKAEVLRKAILKHERTNIFQFHLIGGHVAEVMADAEKYGERAVEVLADAVGHVAPTLYRAAHLHRTIPDRSELERLLARRGKDGQRLTWTHLTTAIEFANGSMWRELVEQVFVRGLSVRGLIRHVRSLTPSSRPKVDGPPPLPKSLKGALMNFGHRSGRLAEGLDRNFPDLVLGPLQQLSPGDATDEVLELVTAGRVGLQALAVQAAARAQELAAVEARLRPPGRPESANGPANTGSARPATSATPTTPTTPATTTTPATQARPGTSASPTTGRPERRRQPTRPATSTTPTTAARSATATPAAARPASATPTTAGRPERQRRPIEA